MKRRIATITLSWNARNDIRNLLECVKKQTLRPDKVIIIDNASSDGTVAMIRKEFPFVTVIELEKNFGYAAGYNIAFSKVPNDIDYVVVLDQDVTIDRNHIERVAARFDREPENTIIIAGDVVEPKIKSLAIEEGYVPDFHGSCFAYRNKFRKEMNFCEEFFGYNNETDLALRLLEKRYRILFYPDWKVMHKKDTTIVTPFTTYYMTRNAIWNFWRNGRLADAVLGSAMMMVVFYSKASRNRTLPAYFRGLTAAFAGLPFCMRTRKPSRHLSFMEIHDLGFIRKKLMLK